MSPAAPHPSGSKAMVHLVLPIAVVTVLALIIIPVPTFLLDLLITVDLALSLVVLLTAMYVPGPSQFNSFPSLLLLMTLFRLSLNIASTRLCLLHGEEGTRAAGVVIEAFGQFVVGGSFVVGIVIFLVLLVVQFVVITHGSTRISEVIARFTLDAMPGKQMAIDADLNAGLITEREAIARRRGIQQEAEFFGAMDGAVRFTQRDAIASIVIVAVNILGGITIGVLQKGMALKDALTTYTILTVGDGLVTAVPALLVAVAGAVITTRAAQQETLGEAVVGQLLLSPKPLKIAAATILGLALIPGLPKIAFFVLAAAIFAGSRVAEASQQERERKVEEAKAEAPSPAAGGQQGLDEEVEPLLGVDPLCVEVGYDLIPAVGADRPGGILDKIKGLRRQIASDMGFVLPPVRVRDNLQLPPNQYTILLRGVKVGNGRIPRGRMLALDAGATRVIEGEQTKDPAFGLPAVWIDPNRADEARASGYTVVDPPSVLSTHLMEVIGRHASDLLGREDVARLVDHLQKTHPKAVSELVPERLTIGEVQRVLQALIKENVPVRDLPMIVEVLADAASTTRDPQILAEAVRRGLGRSITAPLVDETGTLKAIGLSPDLEEELTRAFVPETNDGFAEGISPNRAREVVARMQTAVAGTGGLGVFVVGPRLRPYLAALLRNHLPHTPVFSTLEIPPDVTLRAIATVS